MLLAKAYYVHSSVHDNEASVQTGFSDKETVTDLYTGSGWLRIEETAAVTTYTFFISCSIYIMVGFIMQLLLQTLSLFHVGFIQRRVNKCLVILSHGKLVLFQV